jgi:hypothetical protein
MRPAVVYPPGALGQISLRQDEGPIMVSRAGKKKATKMKTPIKSPPIMITAIRADEVTDDGAVVLTLVTKYSGERSFSAPVACFHGLISDLRRLQLPMAAPTMSAAPGMPANAAMPSTSAMPAVSAVPGTAAAPAKSFNQVTVRTPHKWMIGSGLPKHPVVILIMDPQTETQAGFALNANAAKEMAAGLMKNADALAAHEVKKQ